jgi:penicillin amidase
VRGGALDVAGATLPGVPVFWSGHNARVAWGAVATAAVVTDLYKERLEEDRPDHYFDGRGWRPLAIRRETLAVRGGDPIELEIRATSHGPLLPGRAPAEALALAWTGARIGEPSGIGSLLDVARARDARELVEALASHREPVLAVVYADADGAAGLQVAGWIPHRPMSAGLTTLEGRARLHDWSVPVPFDSLPAAQLLGGEGWIVAADASLAPRARAPIDWLWSGGARSARIESLLRGAARAGSVDLRALAAVQTDVGSPRALRIVASIRELVRASDEPLGPQAAELARMLDAWDGAAGEASQGAAAYHVLLEPLARALLPQPLDEALWRRYLALPHTDPEALLEDLLAEAAGDALASGDSATRLARTLREGLREAWLRLSYRLGPNRVRWTWGHLHAIHFRPLLGLDSVLSEWALAPRPYPGTAYTVQAGAYDPLDPFEVRMASTVRLAFDTGSLDQSLAVLAPGQSEHPGHPHFDDQLAGWLAGRAGLLATGTLLVEETSVARLVLEPVR